MITFPANLKEIGQGAFHSTDLKKVTFEEGSHIEVIGISAFYNCQKLKVVTLPPSVKEIGAYAFWYSGVEQVIFKEGSKLESIGDGAFYGSENLKTINIPLGAVIEEWAFYDTGCPEDIFTPGATIVDC